jgi:uncharacterized protein YacL (UPF0231 family)
MVSVPVMIFVEEVSQNVFVVTYDVEWNMENEIVSYASETLNCGCESFLRVS